MGMFSLVHNKCTVTYQWETLLQKYFRSSQYSKMAAHFTARKFPQKHSFHTKTKTIFGHTTQFWRQHTLISLRIVSTPRTASKSISNSDKQIPKMTPQIFTSDNFMARFLGFPSSHRLGQSIPDVVKPGQSGHGVVRDPHRVSIP